MRKTALFIAAVILGAAVPALAHHAFSAEFDQSKPVKVSGEISRLEWTNPHAWIFIDSKSADGKVVTWRFEMGAPNALLRAGWSKSAYTCLCSSSAGSPVNGVRPVSSV